MKYIQLSDMKVSQIVLGADRYSGEICAEAAYELMDSYRGYGGNIIDTARLYCGGMSEELIGRYLRDTGSRDEIIISTKCAHPPIENMALSRLSLDEIESDVDKSLVALGIDRIDLLWLHRDDVSKPVEPIMEALNLMIKKGKVRHIGASNWSYDRIAQANDFCIAHGYEGFCASQALYNMASCTKIWDSTLAVIEGEEKEKYDRNHFPVFAFCSQAKGFFEKYDENKLSEKSKDRYLNDKTVETYKKIKSEAVKTGDTISYTALRMLDEQSDFDVFPIIGPSNIAQLKSTLNIRD